MIERLRAPLTTGQLIGVAIAASAAVTLYCLAYTALAGRSESPIEAVAWTAVNILPWLAAFEAGKRGGLAAKMLALAGALAVSLALGTLVGEMQSSGFELVRRIPGLLIVASLFAVASLPTKAWRAPALAQPTELPLPPDGIDWIAAAGNYVELHGRGRVLMHRAPLSLIEAQLSRQGFVRVHRSTLVRRDRIARVRPLDVILDDGTVLRTGKRYRAHLGRENFVPSSHDAGGRGADAP